MNVAVLITCHNRREKTLNCLSSLYAQEDLGAVRLKVWLVDDGSRDGTASEVHRRFPDVRVLAGGGELYWCGGMRLAWTRASEEAPAAFLWLNDDVTLRANALKILLASARAQPDAIIVGSCVSPQTDALTYGGRRRAGAHPGKLVAIPPGEALSPCDTFNGNILWVPYSVFSRIGPMSRYRHALGDYDYGYRAAAAGINRLVAPGILGTCSANPRSGTWEDATLRRNVRWRKMWSIKGLPPRDWWHFCLRHGGVRGPMFFLSPYFRVLLGR
jgi:GT2 family glycosyltransferase